MFGEFAALVVDSSSGMCMVGFWWNFSPRAVFLSIVVRPKMLGIMADMNQKDRYVARSLRTCPLCTTTGAVWYMVQ